MIKIVRDDLIDLYQELICPYCGFKSKYLHYNKEIDSLKEGEKVACGKCLKHDVWVIVADGLKELPIE